jgi:uncharacterized spore protein YtfJ
MTPLPCSLLAGSWVVGCGFHELGSPAPNDKDKEQIMSLNRFFDTVEQTRETAHWQAAFGEPHVEGNQTIIPVAQVSYGFGLGFGSGGGPSGEEGEPASEGEGGGGGGGASAKPLGAIVVTPERVYFEEVSDEGKIALFGIAMVAFSIFQVSKTLRAIFGRK